MPTTDVCLRSDTLQSTSVKQKIKCTAANKFLIDLDTILESDKGGTLDQLQKTHAVTVIAHQICQWEGLFCVREDRSKGRNMVTDEQGVLKVV